MEELFGFLGLVIIISASGVMSPGPLFAANVMYGLREGKISGLKMAVGHTIVEFPLILLLGIGFFSIESIPENFDFTSQPKSLPIPIEKSKKLSRSNSA